MFWILKGFKTNKWIIYLKTKKDLTFLMKKLSNIEKKKEMWDLIQ